MTESLTAPLVRVAVLGDGKLADVALPTDLPLREIVPAVRRLVAPASEDDASTARLSLAPLGGAPFSLDATLDAVGIVDGDLLALRLLSAGPAAVSVVEDVADAAALEGAQAGPAWGAELIQRAARVSVAVFLLSAALLGTGWWTHCGGAAARATLVGVALLAVAASFYARFRALNGAGLLSVVALVPVVFAGAAIVPGSLAAPHVLLAAAAAVAWSVLCVLLPAQTSTALRADPERHRATEERYRAAFAGVATFALAWAVVVAVDLVWNVSYVAFACGLILFGLAVTVAAPTLSVLFARLPMPELPAPGDAPPACAPAGMLADLPRRVRRAGSLHTGLVAGATLALVVGAVYLPPLNLPPASAVGWWRWYVALAALAATVLRARVPAGAAAKTWLLAIPTIAGVLGAIEAAREGQWVWALVMVVALGVITVIWLVVAAAPKLGDPEGYSLPARRAVSLVALALDASLLPAMAYVCGLFQWVLAG